MSEPEIAICVVTYNSADLVEDLVASLPEGARGTRWTLVFADNASTDGTLAEIARCAPDAVVVPVGENRGYAGGINAAVRAIAPQDAYLILNPDVRLQADCVATLHRALSPTVGIAVPRLLDAHGQLIWSRRRRPTLARAWADALVGAERAGAVSTLGEVVSDPTAYSSSGPTDWAEGSTQLISAACWAACGPWDEEFFLYSEEADFDLRAGDAGLATWFSAEAVATHLEGDSAGSPRLWALLSVNRVRLYRKRHGPVSSGLFWAATVCREGSRALLGRTTARAAVRDLLSRRRLHETPSPEWLSRVRV